MENWHVAQRDPVSNWEGKLWSSEVYKKMKQMVTFPHFLVFKRVRILCRVQMHINQKGFRFYTISLF